MAPIIPEDIGDELAKTLNKCFRLNTELGRQIADLYMQNPLLKILLGKAMAQAASPYERAIARQQFKVIEGGKDATNPNAHPRSRGVV